VCSDPRIRSANGGKKRERCRGGKIPGPKSNPTVLAWGFKKETGPSVRSNEKERQAGQGKTPSVAKVPLKFSRPALPLGDGENKGEVEVTCVAVTEKWGQIIKIITENQTTKYLEGQKMGGEVANEGQAGQGENCKLSQ